MYVLVRKDLSETYRIIQGSHAIAEYSLRGNLEKYRAWNNGTVIFLGVRNEQALDLWSLKLKDRGKDFITWREPDLKCQTTSLACIDTGEIFKNLNMV
jgi:hypothetical protein